MRLTSTFILVVLGLGIDWAKPAMAQNDLSVTAIPAPDPVAEIAAMRLDPSVQVNLFASDPAIRKPIQMNFDCTGALWVASSEAYPQLKPGQKPNDKIVVLRDVDGDGAAEKATVFAEGLLIPTGVVPDGPHAAYVAESTRLWHMVDTDGDGVADVKKIVFSGFGTEDTHHLIHTLRWGMDGCLYFNQSIYIHSHIDTADGTKRLDGGGLWRYRPTTGQLDVFAKGFINPWGHVLTDDGESLVTDGAFFEGINHAFPDAVFVTSPGATRWLSGLNPGSPKHCGLEILSGTHIPPSWAGDLITNDFRSHRVCRFTIREKGAGYISRQQPELIVSEHVAFRPIDVRMAPDGTVLIADWYNPIIQHGEVDFRDPRRDTEHGRIWRLSFAGRELDHWPSFIDADVPTLLNHLKDPSLAVRQFAREQLWLRLQDDSGANDGLNEVNRWVEKAEAAEKLSRHRERQWLLEAIDHPSAYLPEAMPPKELVQNSPAIVRSRFRAAMQSAELNPENAPEIAAFVDSMIQSLVDADRPSLIREVIVAAGRSKSDRAVLSLHEVAADREDIASDPNLDFAMWSSMKATSPIWIEMMGDANSPLNEIWKRSPRAMSIAARAVEGPAVIDRIIERLSDVSLSDSDAGLLAKTVMAIGSEDAKSRVKALRLPARYPSLSQLFQPPPQPVTKRALPAAKMPAKIDAKIPAKPSWTVTPAWSASIIAMAAEHGSPQRGEAIYRRSELQCIACHAIGQGGGLVGPNLVSLGGSAQPDYILTSLIDPNDKLKEGYSTRKILTDDDQVIVGVEIGRTDQYVALRLADGTTTKVDLNSIVDEQPGASLMPEGLINGLSEAELADLVAFLMALGKSRQFTVSTDPIVRQLETLVYSDEANRRLNRTSKDTASTDDPALVWRSQTTMVDGSIPVDELDTFKQHAQVPPTSFIRFTIEVTPPSGQTEAVPGLSMLVGDKATWDGVEAWIDSRPVPTWDFETLKLAEGRHVVVLAIDRTGVTAPMTLRLGENAATAP